MKAIHFVLPIALGVIGYLGYEIIKSESELPADNASSGVVTPPTTPSSTLKTDSTKPIERVEDSKLNWRKRINTLRAMNLSQMNQSEVDELFELMDRLTQATTSDDLVVLNDVMGKIVQNGLKPDELTRRLTAIVQDTSLHDVVRDYAAQYLGGWIAPQQSNYPSETNLENINTALQTLTESVTDPANEDKSMAGTSLMMLVYAQQSSVDLSSVKENLDTWLDQQISSSKSVTLRADAINAVGMLGDSKHLASLRMIATDAMAHPSHRLTSISSIGLLGSAEDASLLEDIISKDSKYKYAASAALKRIKQSASN